MLCPDCADHRHRSSTLTIHHRVVPLAEVTAGKYNDEIRSKQQIPCIKHEGEDFRFFCETCDVPVCRDCIVLSHQNHRCVAPSDARKHMEENLNSLMTSLNEKVKTFNTAKNSIVSAQKEIEIKREELNKDLEKQMNAIVENLMDSKKRVEKEMNQLMMSKQGLLRTQEESIEVERKILDETYIYCRKILRCGSDIEVLSMKTEMKERLSKLKYSNYTEICDIKAIVLPDIQFCNEGTIFKMEVKMSDKENSKPKDESNAVVAKEHTEDENNEISSTVFQDQPETNKPYYTSIAWLDENTIAVVDKRNQKLKIISREKSVTRTSFVKNCIVVSPYRHGLACRTEGSALHVFNRSLELQKTFTSVSTLFTCHPKSFDICWMSNSKTVAVLRNNDVKEITIYDPNTDSNLSEPKFGHVLLNGTFAVSDWGKECIFLIMRTGCVVRRKYIDSCSKPGSISSDSNYNIYVCDFQRSVVVIFAQRGETLRSVQLEAIAPNPKSIAIEYETALIANSKSIVEVKLK